MDLMTYIQRMREFHEREGYYPAFGESQRRERGEQGDQEASEPEQPIRPPFIPRRRRRPWK